MTAGAPECHQILHVDLGYMCGSVVKGVMVHYIPRRCDLAHVRAITLIADSPNTVLLETLICAGDGGDIRT